MSVELSEKRSELLAEAVPGLKRVAVLTTASNFTATLEYKEMEAAARVLGAKLQILKALDPDMIDSAFWEKTHEKERGLYCAMRHAPCALRIRSGEMGLNRCVG